jgi:mannose-6-phosphate isomerase-like protein (cupin superfamily)
MEHGRDRQATTLLMGEGSQVELSGQLIVRKAGGLTTGGMWVLQEVTFAPYCHSAMPCTSNIARVFYIVAGMLAFTIGEETITVTRGATVVIPPGLVHASFNPTAAPAICLVVGVDGTLA